MLSARDRRLELESGHNGCSAEEGFGGLALWCCGGVALQELKLRPAVVTHSRVSNRCPLGRSSGGADAIVANCRMVLQTALQMHATSRVA
eukprot:7706024-Pyramimonas_sp.AAC.1